MDHVYYIHFYYPNLYVCVMNIYLLYLCMCDFCFGYGLLYCPTTIEIIIRMYQYPTNSPSFVLYINKAYKPNDVCYLRSKNCGKKVFQ